MIWRLPILALAACADPAPVDEPAPPAVDTEPPEPPGDTDPPPDTDLPPDPCVAEPAVLQLGQRDYGSNWTDRAFVPFEPGAELVMAVSPDSPQRWHLDFAAQVTHSPQLLRVSANVTDLATGLPLLNGREPGQFNLTAVPPVIGAAWTCEGTFTSPWTLFDPRGIDDDDTVPVWQELCGRAVRLDVSLRDINTDPVAMATVELVLAPSPDDAETCP
jgi:hypothetical protein